MKFQSWQAVKVQTDTQDHPREGQAGTVRTFPADGFVGVQFDADNELVTIPETALVSLV